MNNSHHRTERFADVLREEARVAEVAERESIPNRRVEQTRRNPPFSALFHDA